MRRWYPDEIGRRDARDARERRRRARYDLHLEVRVDGNPPYELWSGEEYVGVGRGTRAAIQAGDPGTADLLAVIHQRSDGLVVLLDRARDGRLRLNREPVFEAGDDIPDRAVTLRISDEVDVAGTVVRYLGRELRRARPAPPRSDPGRLGRALVRARYLGALLRGVAIPPGAIGS